MKRLSIITLLLLVWPATAVQYCHAFQCNVCHSNNPAMVAMHKAVQAREIGCFDCHRMGEELMGKAPAKDPSSLLAKRATEPTCVECHEKTAKR